MFEALAQETRLKVFRLLVKAGPEGLAAGVLSDQLKTPHNTMSFHLKHFLNAGMVDSRKEGRSVIYSANFEAIGNLLGFLIKDCCSDDVATIRQNKKTGCSIIELTSCCSPKSKVKK